MKELFKKIGNTTANIVTLGGHSRVQDAIEEYNIEYQNYLRFRQLASKAVKQSNMTIEEIGRKAKFAISVINDSQTVLGKLTNSTNFKSSYGDRGELSSITRVKHVNVNLDSAMSMAKGTASSAAFTMGSWALVSMIGTASTGTAIGSLSGVAAYNATLAWFGGGSLATGGAGMFGGGLVLGGLASAPMVIYSSWKAHSNANDINKEIEKIRPKLVKIEEEFKVISDKANQVKAYHDQFKKSLDQLLAVKESVYKSLFPLGRINNAIRWLREYFGGNYYNKKEVDLIYLLDSEINSFLKIFQTD